MDATEACDTDKGDSVPNDATKKKSKSLSANDSAEMLNATANASHKMPLNLPIPNTKGKLKQHNC